MCGGRPGEAGVRAHVEGQQRAGAGHGEHSGRALGPEHRQSLAPRHVVLLPPAAAAVHLRLHIVCCILLLIL